MHSQLIELMDKYFEKKIKEKQLMQREAATVVSVGTGYKRAVVKLANGGTVELLNKTGEKLYDLDSVWIEYRTTPSSGYIAMRNGEVDPIKEGGGTGEEAESVYTASRAVIIIDSTVPDTIVGLIRVDEGEE